ncbi:MAG: phosphoglucosamine mutase [Terriglobales bacterium]
MSSKAYFGTDGIRGVAGEPPLDPATVYAVGLALGDELASRGGGAIVLGLDTRESSPWIAEMLAAGAADRGIHAVSAGVITTPAIAYLTRVGEFTAGVMISASHNPYRDNGIKIFGHSGYKLPDAEEAEIEDRLGRYLATGVRPRRLPLPAAAGLHERYVAFLAGRLDGADLSRRRVLVDCGYGAASGIAAEVLRRVGVTPALIADQPNGRNINDHCGALFPEAMAAQVLACGAEAGLALDGDADRVIMADAQGRIVDGDRMLFIAARFLQAQSRLHPPRVVGTVMSNLGLELVLRPLGIALDRAPVGDKYVLEAMLANGALLGGEPSGHVIFRQDATTGDGLLTALRVLEVMAREHATLAELAAPFQAFPQKLVNVPVRQKTPLAELPTVQSAIADAERYFGAQGRVLVRYSGTEKLARVMVEAASAAEVERHSQAIAAALRAALGE